MILSLSPFEGFLRDSHPSCCLNDSMTTTQIKPKASQSRTRRKTTTTPKTMTESTYPVTKQRDFTHKEPVIIPSHLEEIPVISAASYIKDARNRWYIHTVELKEVWDVHVDMFNKVKPHALNAHDYIVKRYQEMMSKD